MRLMSLILLALLAAGCPAGGGQPSACDGVDCSGHGRCALVDAAPVCLCDEGYRPEGLSCPPDPVDPCQGVTCSGHGGCTPVDDEPACVCQAGFHAEGLTCVEDGQTGPCDSVDCAPGWCEAVGDQAACRCPAGYHPEGLVCAADPVDPCEGVDCSGHGSCAVQDDAPVCDCDPGYHPEGLACAADPADPCEGIDCSGHGLCAADAHDQPGCVCDEGYEPDGLACVETLCHCRERTAVVHTACTYVQACQTAADCCPANLPGSLECGRDYPYRYACVAGTCENTYCTQDADCARWAQYLTEATSAEYLSLGCKEIVDECGGGVLLRYCDVRQACQSAADCCASLSDPWTCNQDYPYLYTCSGGACSQVSCDSNSQCQVLFDSQTGGDPTGWVLDGCVDSVDPCTDEVWYSTCQYAQACQTAADCCPVDMPAGYTCLADYPYLFACDQGRCRSADCSAGAQCDAYFQQVYANTGYVNLGCE